MEWIVRVNNTQMAEQNLFRLLASNESIFVTDFHVKQHNLEEVFLDIVEGGKHVNRK
jgi:hypothetical protein